jgi:hypothetical protein
MHESGAKSDAYLVERLHRVTQSLRFLTFPCRLNSMKSQKLQNLLTEKENIAHFDLIRRFTTLSISKIELDDFLLFLRWRSPNAK